jgi:type IV fimbrial biogenesis protein FimT
MLLTHNTPARSAGFSLIELSVALTIACVLLALGAPSVSGYLQNARLGSMAQSFYGGLQTARTAAIQNNQNAEFVLTNTPLDAATMSSIVPSTSGKNWWVYTVDSTGAPASSVESKATNGNDLGTVAISASSPTFTFNALGAASAVGPVGIALTNPALGACSPAGPVRCWSVIVSTGGQIRLCSPDPTLNSRDSRAC